MKMETKSKKIVRSKKKCSKRVEMLRSVKKSIKEDKKSKKNKKE